MRAALERDTASGSDAYNAPLAPSFTAVGTLACFVWSPARRDRIIADGEKSAVVEDMRAMFPRSTDIRQGDEIASVSDRRGNEIIGGRLRVDAPPVAKHRHLEVALTRVS